MKKLIKEHILFLLFIGLAFIVFMGRMFIMKESFITGDNLVQAYPWLYTFSSFIKSHLFPFWVNGIHCGFPLVGEGQVGAFYPLNLLFFYLLPFKYAYNIMILFHFAIAAVSTYFLTRKLGADVLGGALAAFVLCFGSAFANIGYHIGMMRALVWFPVVLLLLEYYLDKNRLVYMLFAAIVVSFQMLSGSLQMAVYSVLFYLVYYVYGKHLKEDLTPKAMIPFFGAMIIPVIVFIPQLLLTLKVVANSARQASLSFALWGSLNPISIFTTVFPGVFRFKGHISTEDIFLGVLTLLFLLSALRRLGDLKRLRPMALVAALAVFLSLGFLNPLYVIAIDLAGFYTFRAPARFIFFFIFGCSVLSGVGFTGFFTPAYKIRRFDVNFFLRSVFISFFALFAVVFAFIALKTPIIRFGQRIVERFIFNSPFHRYNLADYFHKVNRIYDALIETVIFKRDMVVSVVFIVLAIVYGFIIKRRSMRIKQNRIAAQSIALTLIFINLFTYRMFPGSYKENVRDFKSIEPYGNIVYETIKKDASDFRIYPYDVESGKLPFWCIPNVNMYFGISSIGAYSPLSGKSYREVLEPFQVVDDSIGLKPPEEDALSEKNVKLLKMMNVKYVISPQHLENDAMEKLIGKGELHLYRLKSLLKKGFFSKDINGTVVSDEGVKIISYKPGSAEFELESLDSGYFVFSESFFPGWTATVNGEDAEIRPFKGILQAVKCERGKNHIVFKYKAL